MNSPFPTERSFCVRLVLAFERKDANVVLLAKMFKVVPRRLRIEVRSSLSLSRAEE